ncbi:MAG: glutamate-5-semialdehyde dehydrogenase [Aestuariivita sp.]|nr:glutamate-5-semialdehyde dehydrogenase [Aestuariivita sp.]
MKDIDDNADVMLHVIGEKARNAARVLADVSHEQKKDALKIAADEIQKRKTEILEKNMHDIVHATKKNLSDAMIDRLTLSESRIVDIRNSLFAVAETPDPVGEVIAEWQRPSGINIQRVRTPLGVIGVIYESRPNVTSDAAALCLKSGNAVILRGGSEISNTAHVIHSCLISGLKAVDLPIDAIQRIPTQDRSVVNELLKMSDYIDVLVPRGGKSLVELVQRESRIPVFAHLEGIVHIYIDKDADQRKALEVVMNSKTRRPGICGAVECLLFHEEIIDTVGETVISELIKAGVKVHADDTMLKIAGTMHATEQDWGREYLSMDIATKSVSNIDAAIDHIRFYGSGHTDCIITENTAARDKFFAKLDSAILMQNSSTQFADGGEFGLGAEIGIATGKMHARGPVGAIQLTSFKYLVTADCAIRP